MFRTMSFKRKVQKLEKILGIHQDFKAWYKKDSNA